MSAREPAEHFGVGERRREHAAHLSGHRFSGRGLGRKGERCSAWAAGRLWAGTGWQLPACSLTSFQVWKLRSSLLILFLGACTSQKSSEWLPNSGSAFFLLGNVTCHPLLPAKVERKCRWSWCFWGDLFSRVSSCMAEGVKNSLAFFGFSSLESVDRLEIRRGNSHLNLADSSVHECHLNKIGYRCCPRQRNV